jgi:hypothetical protein
LTTWCAIAALMTTAIASGAPPSRPLLARDHATLTAILLRNPLPVLKAASPHVRLRMTESEVGAQVLRAALRGAWFKAQQKAQIRAVLQDLKTEPPSTSSELKELRRIGNAFAPLSAFPRVARKQSVTPFAARLEALGVVAPFGASSAPALPFQIASDVLTSGSTTIYNLNNTTTSRFYIAVLAKKGGPSGSPVKTGAKLAFGWGLIALIDKADSLGALLGASEDQPLSPTFKPKKPCNPKLTACVIRTTRHAVSHSIASSWGAIFREACKTGAVSGRDRTKCPKSEQP